MPTNVVLYVAGEQVGEDGPSLETAAGVQVSITVNPVVPTGFDITPTLALEPNERYILRHPGFSLLAAGPVNTSVEFETGSGPAEPAMLPPPELAGAVVLDAVESPCPNERLCLEPGGSDSALFAAHSFGDLSERSPGSLSDAYGIVYVPPGCLQVWRRDALGNHSDVVELCAPDVTRVELSGDAASTTCGEYRYDVIGAGEQDVRGCSLAVFVAPQSHRTALGAVFGLIAMLGVRRHHRRTASTPGRPSRLNIERYAVQASARANHHGWTLKTEAAQPNSDVAADKAIGRCAPSGPRSLTPVVIPTCNPSAHHPRCAAPGILCEEPQAGEPSRSGA